MSKELKQIEKDRFTVKDVVDDLQTMMRGVTKSECTPATVNAACNAADKITNLLKLQLEYERMQRSFARNRE
jgi:hypothetical protein